MHVCVECVHVCVVGARGGGVTTLVHINLLADLKYNFALQNMQILILLTSIIYYLTSSLFM